MQILKVIPTRTKAIPMIAALALGTGAICNAHAQNGIKEDEAKVITVNDSTEMQSDKEKTVSWDVAARTFQFMDGSNLSCVSTGVSKNWKDLSGYFTVMGGYNFANKLPMVGTMGFFDYKYPKQNPNANLSAELYHESGLNKEGLSQKFAVTPIKLNTQLSDKIYFGLDPRMAFHVASKHVVPKFEILATVSGQIYNKLSGYVIGQIYDVTQPKNPSNYSVNAGLIKSF